MKWFEHRKITPRGCSQLPKGCETETNFAKRVGVSPRTLGYWIERGLPVYLVGRAVRTEDGLKWWSIHHNKGNNCGNGSHLPDGHESQKAFARRLGASKNFVHNLVKLGLPLDANTKAVFIEEGLRWTREGEHTNMQKPPKGYETQTAFARRISVSNSVVYKCIKKGMPTLSNGAAIHIEGGLAWLAKHRPDLFGRIKARLDAQDVEA